MAAFTGHGVMPEIDRTDLYDVDDSTGGQSATYPDLAQTSREYYGISFYTRILRVVERDVGEPITTCTSCMANFGYLGQWVQPLVLPPASPDRLRALGATPIRRRGPISTWRRKNTRRIWRPSRAACVAGDVEPMSSLRPTAPPFLRHRSTTTSRSAIRICQSTSRARPTIRTSQIPTSGAAGASRKRPSAATTSAS